MTFAEAAELCHLVDGRGVRDNKHLDKAPAAGSPHAAT